MLIPIFQVDAFTAEPFKGNPAAVCLLKQRADERWMQNVAMEMNLSETAFVRPIDDGFDLRWFTPDTEVDLCGHATLASAHILWEAGKLNPDQPARFSTRSGWLICQKRGAGIEMDFPATPAQPAENPAGLLESLGIRGGTVGKSKFDLLVELESQEQVAAMKPDFPQLKKIQTRGVIVTAPGTGQFDYVCRFFAPRVGIDEDPVTGSAQCCLGPWWSSRLKKHELLGHQISRRGGIVRVSVNETRVLLSGQAVTTLRGELVE